MDEGIERVEGNGGIEDRNQTLSKNAAEASCAREQLQRRVKSVTSPRSKGWGAEAEAEAGAGWKLEEMTLRAGIPSGKE